MKKEINQKLGENYLEMALGQLRIGNDKLFFKFINEASDCGNLHAQRLLAEAYHDGTGTKQNYKKAKEIYEDVANNDVITKDVMESQFNLAIIYSKGEGIKVDLQKSLEWLKKSADNGYTTAQHTYGHFVEKGLNGAKVNLKEAEKYYIRAAVSESVDAQSSLIMLYMNNDEYDDDIYTKKAIYWLNKATENGHKQTGKILEDLKAELGDECPSFYECVEAVQEDYANVLQEQKNAMKNSIKRELNLSDSEAEEMLEKMIEQREEEMKSDKNENADDEIKDFDINEDFFDDDIKDFDLDEDFKDDEIKDFNLDDDFNDELKANKKNLDKKNVDNFDEINTLIEEGLKLSQKDGDFEGAFKKWQKAYEMGSLVAGYNLAQCYDFGDGVEKNPEKGFKMFLECASSKTLDKVIVANAQYRVGNGYFNGNGVKQDYKKAFEWYEKAADNGNEMAQYNMALCYFTGNHLSQDYNKCFRYASLAVKNDYLPAYTILGSLYLTGQGARQNVEMAKKYLSIASSRGDTGAMNILKQILIDESR